MFGSEQLMYNTGGGDFYSYPISGSARFVSGAYLYRTVPSAGNRKTWTFSTWVKRSALGTQQDLLGGGPSSDQLHVQFYDDRFGIRRYASGTTVSVYTQGVLRDPSAWYHLVVSVDTTQATDSERIKLFVNGKRETSPVDSAGGAVNWPSLNEEFYILDTITIGRRAHSVDYLLEANMAETHFCDGNAYDASAFGEFKSGVWIPKQPSVSYGTNGFYLDMGNSFELDQSGNGNNWTNYIITSHDYMLDSPTNNFATLNPLEKSGNVAYSEGNLRANSSSTNSDNAYGSMYIPSSGKYYFEMFIEWYSVSTTPYIAVNSNQYRANGQIYKDGVLVTTVATQAVGDIVAMAVDADNDTFKFYKNGTEVYSATATSTPLYGTRPVFYRARGASSFPPGDTQIANFGQDSSFAGNKVPQGYTDANGRGDFYYAPPAGYLALCTANLPEPAIGPNSASTSDEHFNTVLYTGDGTTGHAITGVGFQPDFTWIKERSSTSAHQSYDTIRGANKNLSSSSTSAEISEADAFSSFDVDGFTVGANNGSNQSSQTYVAWNWKANGSGVSNTDGSITSTVSANVDAGFSIVTFTGTETPGPHTIGHGLTQAPEVLIGKATAASESWVVYHHENTGAPETDLLRLNNTNATTDLLQAWQDTAPTSSVFTVGSDGATNSTGGMVYYCFHGVEGYSKFGSYIGNGSTDGPYVHLGFRPAFVMVKRTDGANNWIINDNQRGTYNVEKDWLYANLSNAEAQADFADFTSNGFKVRNSASAVNASGGSYIYMAFAENPFKYSNAR